MSDDDPIPCLTELRDALDAWINEAKTHPVSDETST